MICLPSGMTCTNDKNDKEEPDKKSDRKNSSTCPLTFNRYKKKHCLSTVLFLVTQRGLEPRTHGLKGYLKPFNFKQNTVF